MSVFKTNPRKPFHYDISKPFSEEFQNPSNPSRPRMRWWLPSTYLSEEGLERDIHAMAAAGFSGAEVVPMPRFDIPGDFTIEWGTLRWKRFMKHILVTAKKYNFTIDFSMTPFWPLALPGIEDASEPEQGAQMETDGSFVDGITREQPFNGDIPVPWQARKDAESVSASPRLVAVTCAKYIDKASGLISYDSARAFKLHEEVLQDDAAPMKWRLSFTPDEAGEFVLFAWWEHPSGNRTCQNLQLDHYSLAATNRLIHYWEKELIPFFGESFSCVVSMFIDSLEYSTHLDWTPGFLEKFQEKYHFDLSPYLPALYDESSPGCFVSFPRPPFRFDKKNEQILNDYYEFLTTLYIDNHLTPLTAFCERYHLNLRYQTSYGKNLELAKTAMYVSIPETETLYGADILDFYRIQSGAVHISGKPVYSIEASAEMKGRGNGTIQSGNYQQTWGNQLWHIQRAFSGCVNQVVFHGYSYEGFYDGEDQENGFLPGTHWPGYTTMGYSEFSNNWGPTQPNWLHANHYIDFLARTQATLRFGVGKIDLAIYRQSFEETIDFNHAEKSYRDGGLLEQSGYTYDFICPSAILFSQVDGKRLEKNGPSYKAIIFDHCSALPYDIAVRLLEFAKKGLPMIFIEKLPNASSFSHEKDIASLITLLSNLPNVKLIESVEEVPGTLKSLGVSPRVAYGVRSKVLNVCRESDLASFYYFYNYGDADTYPKAQSMGSEEVEVTIHDTGVPYIFHTWDGTYSPIAGYRISKDGIVLRITLDKNDSKVIGIIKDEMFLTQPFPKIHIEMEGLPAEYTSENHMIVKSMTGHTAMVSLSNGDSHKLCFQPVSQPFNLKGWKLLLERWSESDIPAESRKTNYTFTDLDELVSWKHLPGQEYTSGIGIYNVSFYLEKAWEDGIGYILTFQNICDSYDIQINDVELHASQTSKQFDIGKYLHTGENHITVTVASPLLNAVLDYTYRQSLTYPKWQQEVRVPDDYGIIGAVQLIPYSYAAIDL